MARVEKDSQVKRYLWRFSYAPTPMAAGIQGREALELRMRQGGKTWDPLGKTAAWCVG